MSHRELDVSQPPLWKSDGGNIWGRLMEGAVGAGRKRTSAPAWAGLVSQSEPLTRSRWLRVHLLPGGQDEQIQPALWGTLASRLPVGRVH